MSRMLHVRRVCVVLVVVCGLLGSALRSAAPADAAGITTHGWMAVEAIDRVSDPALKALLQAHREQVRAGASFPDVGYVGTNTYGEEAHWQRFVDAYVGLIMALPTCGDITDPEGPCADLVAHAFGVAAHGMGDEVWDWLFEPNGPDRNEYWTNPDVPTANEGGAETQMDLVAIGRYGVPRPVTPPLPDVPMLLTAFQNSGLSGVTASQFDLVPYLPMLWDAEQGWATDHLADVEVAMPWMAANMVTAPGGVDFAATAIAGYWSTLWGRIRGDQPQTSVSITYPAPNQHAIPASGWDRASFQPGSARGRGGAQNRIAAVLTSSRPYVPAGGGAAVPAELPADTMTITDVAAGTPVALKPGFPRSVPYGGDAGQHVIDVQPAENLATCTWYRVDVGVDAPLTDNRGQAIAPYSWSFRTSCPDDVQPPPPSVPPQTTTLPTSLTSTPPGAVLPVALPAEPTVGRPTYTG